MKHSPRFLTLAALGAASLASAALLARTTPVTLGGRTLRIDSVVVGGRTYVALDQLRAGFAAPGGAGELTAAQGRIGDWMFNGAWRFRVTNVAWNAADRFWDVSIELKNGTRQTRHAGGEGLDPTPSNSFHLATEGGNALDIPLGSLANGLQVEIGYRSLAPGMGTTAVLHFPGGREGDRPVKLIAEFGRTPGVATGRDPSFRIDLTPRGEGTR